MRKGVIVSVLFHLTVVALLYFGGSMLFQRTIEMDSAMVVDLVDVAPERNLPPEPAPTRPQAEEARLAPRPATAPEPVAVAAARPEPVAPAPTGTRSVAAVPAPAVPAASAASAVPDPSPRPIAPPPPPKPARERAETPAPAPAPEPEPVADAAPVPTPPERPPVAATPPREETPPAPPRPTEDDVLARLEERLRAERPAEPARPTRQEEADPFASVLRSVERLERAEPAETRQQAVPASDPVRARADTPFQPDRLLTQTQIDAIRQQIQRNWNVPAGARDAENMVVEILVRLRSDGSVREAEIVDAGGRMQRDPFYRAMAESALRAVMITHRIENLSSETYESWREMRLRFDPREMFG